MAEAWNLKGEMTLSCSCTVFCPCVLSLGDHPPTEDRCQTWAGFRFDSGHFDDVDLGGINAGIMMDLPGIMSRGNWTAALFVDDAASAQAVPDLGGKTVVVVTENAYPPLQFVDPKSGEQIGWEYDAMNEIAKRLSDVADRKLLTAYGTLYRALARLEKMGLLQSRWEDPEIPARENRPGRRLYALTAAAETTILAVQEAAKPVTSRARLRLRRRPLPA